MPACNSNQLIEGPSRVPYHTVIQEMRNMWMRLDSLQMHTDALALSIHEPHQLDKFPPTDTLPNDHTDQTVSSQFMTTLPLIPELTLGLVTLDYKILNPAATPRMCRILPDNHNRHINHNSPISDAPRRTYLRHGPLMVIIQPLRRIAPLII